MMAQADDDAKVAKILRESRELDKAVVDKIRKDGTFDSIRRRITEEVGQKARGRGMLWLKFEALSREKQKKKKNLAFSVASRVCSLLYTRSTGEPKRPSYASEELRAFMAEALAHSRTLASQEARYGRLKEKELVDRLREEMEEVVMSAGQK